MHQNFESQIKECAGQRYHIVVTVDEPVPKVPWLARKTQFERSHPNQPFYAKFRKKTKR